jgi:hypothetical protein
MFTNEKLYTAGSARDFDGSNANIRSKPWIVI